MEAARAKWTDNRIDARFDAFESRLDERFREVDTRFERLEASIDARLDKVDERFERLEASMTERFDRLYGLLVKGLVALIVLIGGLSGSLLIALGTGHF